MFHIMSMSRRVSMNTGKRVRVRRSERALCGGASARAHSPHA